MLQSPYLRYLAWFIVAYGGYRYLKRLVLIFASPLARLPGPKYPFFLGPLSLLVDKRFAQQKGFEIHEEWHRQYDSKVIRIGPQSVSVNDAALVHEILVTKDLPKSKIYDQLVAPGRKHDVLTVQDKHNHKFLRRFLSPAFSIKYLNGLEKYMADLFQKLATKLERRAKESSSGETTINIWKETKAYSVDVIGETAFGNSFGAVETGKAPIVDILERGLRAFAIITIFPFLKYMPFLPMMKKAKEGQDTINDYMTNLVKERRDGTVYRDDIMQIMIDGLDPDSGEKMQDPLIMQTAILFINAGSDTTGATMAYTLIELVRNPECLAKVEAEVLAVPVDPTTGLITASTAKGFTYLNSCINETLRLAPVATGVIRSTRDQEVTLSDGTFLPKETDIMIPIWAIHRGSIWDEPDRFNPDRFTKLAEEGVTNGDANNWTWSLIPFSSGSRNCVGKQFANMEMLLFLSNFIRSFEIRDANPSQSTEKAAFVTLTLAGTPNGWKASLPYKTHNVQMQKNEQKTEWFTKINPNGRIPAMVDHSKGGKDGFAVFESGAILLYLAEHYDPKHILLPADPLKRSQAIQWIMWQMGGLGPMQGQANHFSASRYAPEKIPYAIKRYQDETRRLYQVLDTHLKETGNEYIVGEFSAADIINIGWIGLHDWAGVSLDGLQHLQKWMDRMLQRPATRKGLDVPGKNPMIHGQTQEELKKREEGGRALIAQQLKEIEEKKKQSKL
ncbi:hypothetical protein SmJEL517_g05368 [Synchytrium microbalum]|uniref:Glutathione transferase n=1 Tax=Synchytrium microbalum TaxID=1806994 RepID=A0A507BVQ6_9FUNG|nr:uncharacterized protein SmJEL517_g05368 [Synchytrium microbalum]TPX31231.1 hypothetical protein SmJEL517_g05368 [Synchytrium microbalum]